MILLFNSGRDKKKKRVIWNKWAAVYLGFRIVFEADLEIALNDK